MEVAENSFAALAPEAEVLEQEFSSASMGGAANLLNNPFLNLDLKTFQMM